MENKGFTIIELIVVIAIIAVLAAIVLVNVTSYINKAKVAAIQGNMATLLTNAAAYFDGNGSKNGNDFVADTTTGLGTTSPIKFAIANAGGTATGYGNTTGQGWCAWSTLPSGGSYNNWCIDSTGAKVGNIAATKCSSTSNITCQ